MPPIRSIARLTREKWAAPKNAAHPTGSTGTCFNCGLRFSPERPYGGIDEADGVPMCEQCWEAYGTRRPVSPRLKLFLIVVLGGMLHTIIACLHSSLQHTKCRNCRCNPASNRRET